jgi:hypothetical protein
MRATSKIAKHDTAAHPVEDRLLSLSFYGAIVFIVALIVATLPRVPF